MTASPSHNLAALLARTATAWPTQAAVAIGDRVQHDYRTLAHRAARLARGLGRIGCQRGDRIVLVAHNVTAYIETLFACWWGGFVGVPVNSKLHANELAYVLEHSGARAVFVDAAWDDALRSRDGIDVVPFDGPRYRELLDSEPVAMPAAVALDDAAWLFYTSGTTGRPKGVVITHGNLRAMALAFLADVEPVAPGDALLHAAPLSHGSGLYLVPHVARGALNVVPESGGFDADEIAALVARWPRTSFFAAPTMVKRLVDARASLDLSHLKCIVYGGGPMYVADAKAAFAAFGARLAQIYGQGETPMTITAMDRALLAAAFESNDEARLASVGIAQLGIEIRIAGADDAPLPGGEDGEVLVRGPTVMREYWNNPAATAATLANGWLHTGDVGHLDETGFLTLKDRSKDLIISGGTNIYPREVEEALLTHAAVAEVAVIGRHHPEWGEEVVACVVAREPVHGETRMALERSLDAHCLATIARFKRPRAYVFVDALPKNEAGKVLKRTLRDRFGSASPQPERQ